MRLNDIFRADAHPAVLLIRLAVALTFLVAGTRKLLDLESAGGNFANIGFPMPQLLAGMVGSFEVLCGSLVLIGFATRAAAVPLMAIMVMAIISTKLPVLVGGEVGPFSGPNQENVGLMPFLNQVRLDFTMLMSATFLAIVGAGRISADAKMAERVQERPRRERERRRAA